MKPALVLPIALIATLAACSGPDAAPRAADATHPAPAADLVARGEYLVRIAACNDCHTAGFAEAQGKVPKEKWLLGSPLGYKGPWGTTYAPNLRLRLAQMDEAGWLAYSANLHTRPIMPDYALRDVTEDDRRAIYRFVTHLGPAGTPAPAALPPGVQPPAPYFELVLPAPPKPGA